MKEKDKTHYESFQDYLKLKYNYNKVIFKNNKLTKKINKEKRLFLL